MRKSTRNLNSIFNAWRYYTMGRDNYVECMQSRFIDNLIALRQVNFICAILAFIWTLFPIIIENNPAKGVFYIIASCVAFILYFITKIFSNKQKNGKHIHKSIIYLLIILCYANTMQFGLYIGVWSNPEVLAVNFMVFLVCALFLFNIPPALNMLLTLTTLTVFIISTSIIKSPQLSNFDISNSVIAACVSLVFSWYICRYRMLAEYNAAELEKERNRYFNESLEDELTGLKNRRDFTQTLHRYLTSSRESDKYLCVALIDIDYFKNYNDYYGHPMGDECLRMVGKMFEEHKNDVGVYAARIGGEEFALLWFTENRESAEKTAEQLHQRLSKLNIPHAKSQVSERITISVGIYISECMALGDTDKAYAAADAALYEAKNNGRNQTIISEDFTR